MSPLDEARARRYLLGQMSADETDALEGEYFADSDLLEQVWGVENDLVDAYVAGALGPDERAAFEGHYLSSPVHRERVAAARALQAAATAAETPAGSSWTPWLALAAALVMILASWWMGREPAPVRSVEATPTTPQSVAPPPTAVPVLESAAPPPPRAVAAFALSPVLLRGGLGTPVLRVAPRTDELALTLEGERPLGVPRDAHLPFVVTTVEGETVTRGTLVPEGDGLGVARILADRVPPGDYILSVRLGERDDLLQYFFRVQR